MNTFLADEKLKRAVGMTVINIGELIKNMTEEFRLSHKEVPWKAFAGLRDIAAHKYQTLRMEDIYNTATMDLPDLKEKIISILNNDNE
ncbi:HepT-like ribonuclease domain-containing protein [Ruminococcus sp.]|uniref:HepT-like ribonuclease domain-containing protein n=1 Tax=Ruminococcus sp. TaxID=41978 RepID=UPI0025CFCE53|nr:HepT-like ribonuclease domain-containing protein [Ruminococcus sp.]